jgi:hypothetical protein
MNVIREYEWAVPFSPLGLGTVFGNSYPALTDGAISIRSCGPAERRYEISPDNEKKPGFSR